MTQKLTGETDVLMRLMLLTHVSYLLVHCVAVEVTPKFLSVYI